MNDDTEKNEPAAEPADQAESARSNESAIWYYAVEDKRHGPIALAELETLLNSGGLTEADLIWREGMNDWEPAAELGRLSDPDGIPPIHRASRGQGPPRLLTRERLEKVRSAAESRARQGVRWLKSHTEPRTWVLVGLGLLIVSRGCDAVAMRGVERLDARRQLTVSTWDGKAKRRRQSLESRVNAVDGEDRQKLQKQLAQLDAELVQQRRELEANEWWELEQAASTAANRAAIWGYWRQWLAMAGMGVLAASLGAVATSDQSPDRVVAMAMLAILLWSLVVDGAIWE